ncbi:MAG: SAP domain-containing protein, partial [Butyricicoccus sp.]|nr:SAP domain-containing protein [Butyricicoccus sp.]
PPAPPNPPEPPPAPEEPSAPPEEAEPAPAAEEPAPVAEKPAPEAPAPVEDLHKMTVAQLRSVARGLNTGLSRRDIRFAKKEELIARIEQAQEE